MNSRIVETDKIAPALEAVLSKYDYSGLYVVTDTNVKSCVLPLIEDTLSKYDARVITFEAGEENKNINTLSKVWQTLSESGATRKSLIINLGGGVVTDLGGFAAATFKRGIRFVNIPTSVLGAVDAAVGGKTGIDFCGLKNEIGAFYMPEAVIISSEPLSTLPEKEIGSGFGEIVKMAMITSEDSYRLTLDENILRDKAKLAEGMLMSIREKERIVEEDPKESGLRKVLNFGHTAGHALETLMLEKGTPVSHGEAVANGILVSLILSHMIEGMSSDEIYRYRDGVLRRHFKPIQFSCNDYDRIEEIVSHDKKNPSAGDIRFVLLEKIGKPHIDVPVLNPDLRSAMDIYRDLLSL